MKPTGPYAHVGALELPLGRTKGDLKYFTFSGSKSGFIGLFRGGR
jgi:hypothetical protein